MRQVVKIRLPPGGGVTLQPVITHLANVPNAPPATLARRCELTLVKFVGGVEDYEGSREENIAKLIEVVAAKGGLK